VIPLLASEKYFHTALQPYLRKNIGSQPNSAVFFTYRDNSAKPNISRIFFQPSVILKKSAWGLLVIVGV